MSKEVSRLAFIDALKAIASQLIVLHHLAFYGPLSDAAHRAAPSLFGWLASDARIAVQVFLVIGGFLAARSLAPNGVLSHHLDFGALIKKRYLKLAPPFLAAVLVSILLSALARELFIDEAIPDRPTALQFLSHAALMHGILGFDSLSAGVWYVAIDFQLFALLLGLLWLARKSGRHAATAGAVLVTGLALLSLFHFNRMADWDNWALYFFGAYGGGALAYWMSRSRNTFGWIALALIGTIALMFDFRSRILVALFAMIALGLASERRVLETWPRGAAFAWLGQISYSVFLIHFPLILIINGLYVRFSSTLPLPPLLVAGFAWALSVLAGAVFHHHVESRAGHWPARITESLARLGARIFPARGTRS